MLSASSLASCTIPTTKFSNRPLHIVLIHFIAATLGASPFVVRLLLNPSSFIDAALGSQLAPHVHVQVLLFPACAHLAGALLDSIDLGDVDGAVALLSDGQCPNHVDDRGVPPLYAALNQKNAVIASALLQAHADVHCRYDFGGTALHLACKQGLPAAVSHLLQAKADVDARDNENDTPLHVAAVHGDVACVRLLLEAGAHARSADVRARNFLLETPLVSSFSCGVRGAVVAELLDFDWPEEWLTILCMNVPSFALMLEVSSDCSVQLTTLQKLL
jgi:ankyrin repeat protein